MGNTVIRCTTKKLWVKVQEKAFREGHKWNDGQRLFGLVWEGNHARCINLNEHFMQYSGESYYRSIGCIIIPAEAYLIEDDATTKLSASKDKLRYDLIPIKAIEEVVRVFMYGAEKYEAWDWYKRPLPWSTYYNASYRHGISMWGHEDIDVESGLHTRAHKIASDIILLTYQLEGIGEDDRR